MTSRVRGLSHMLLQFASVPAALHVPTLEQIAASAREAHITVSVMVWGSSTDSALTVLSTTGTVIATDAVLSTAAAVRGELWQYLEPLQEALLADMQHAREMLGHADAHSACAHSTCTQQATAGMSRPRRPLLRARALLGGGAACRGESLDSYGHLSADGCMRSWIPSYSNTQPRTSAQDGVAARNSWYLYGMS